MEGPGSITNATRRPLMGDVCATAIEVADVPPGAIPYVWRTERLTTYFWPQRPTELFLPPGKPQADLFDSFTVVCRVLSSELRHRPSLARGKRHNSMIDGRHYSRHQGVQTLNSMWLQHTSTVAQTSIEKITRAGKHGSNGDELKTDSVHAVFTDKSQAKIFGT